MAVIGVPSFDRSVGLPLALLAAIAYPVYIFIYRLFFSPLSKVPGPWQTRISSLLEVNALRAQRRTQWVSDLFAENPGAVAVRTGPSSVSFNHPDAVKAIYGSQFILVSEIVSTTDICRPWQRSGRVWQVELVVGVP
jgi:benzoate 4-monooxygenase